MNEWMFFLWSGIGCVWDIRSRTVPRAWIAVGALCILFWTDMSVWDSVLGMIPGSCLLILSKLTEGKLGRGDGLYLIILGGCFGIRSGCLTIFSGIFLAALFSDMLCSSFSCLVKFLGSNCGLTVSELKLVSTPFLFATAPSPFE